MKNTKQDKGWVYKVDKNGVNLILKYSTFTITLLYYILPIFWYGYLHKPIENLLLPFFFIIPLAIFHIIGLFSFSLAYITLGLSAIINCFVLYTLIRIIKNKLE